MFKDYQLLLDSLGAAVLLLDHNGFIIYANPAITDIAGYSPTELQQQSFAVLHPYADDDIKVAYELDQARKTGAWNSEGWWLRKDGSRFWGEIVLRPAHDAQQQPAGYSCLLRDTGSRKEKELALRSSEERYRLMVEGVRDYAIFMLDPTGHILTWNEGARRTKGYSANEIIGRHFSTFYTSEDLEDGKPARELRIATATGKYEEEGWRVKKNGSVFWANVVITALHNEQNQLIGFSKVTRDLTERKEAQETLKQSEERYRSLVEQVTDYGIFMMDEQGRIISWNEGAQKINGYSSEEIIGKYFSIFYPEEDIISGKPAYELEVAREKGKYEEEGWRLRKDGSLFWASVVITAVYSTNDLLIGFTKVTRDLTERKHSEKALRDSNEQYRLLAKELKTANTELSYANQELGQFTSIVSHDLQEPVRTVKSFLQLIDIKLAAGEYGQLKTYTAKSIRAINRMRELIQNLLHYTQLDKDTVEIGSISVDELISQALQNLKTSIDASNAHVTVDSSVDYVNGDRVQLLQLLQNLLSNAIKFTDADNPNVQIKCWKEADGTVTFAVADNGIGMEPKDQNKIFEIFRRLNTKKDYPGTGIGLAICKKIVDRHKGRIWPESEPGKGTTFYFTLNRQAAEV